MAQITAGIGCSHVPAIGAAQDLNKTDDPYWRPIFEGFQWTRRWMTMERCPDIAS